MKARLDSLMPIERHELALEIARRFLDLEDLGYYTQTDIPFIYNEEDLESYEEEVIEKIVERKGLPGSVDTILRTCNIGPEDLLRLIKNDEQGLDQDYD